MSSRTLYRLSGMSLLIGGLLSGMGGLSYKGVTLYEMRRTPALSSHSRVSEPAVASER